MQGGGGKGCVRGGGNSCQKGGQGGLTRWPNAASLITCVVLRGEEKTKDGRKEKKNRPSKGVVLPYCVGKMSAGRSSGRVLMEDWARME